MAQERAYDVVVFGATGFTGGLVADYIAAHGGRLRWALAGRNRDKLERVRARLGGAPAILIADSTDSAALASLARQTKVVLTTVGPYWKHGEPLVEACADAGTHYVDLTGEPPFVAETRARFHERAQATGAKIVHACGFDSIPHDLGAYYTLLALRRRLGAAADSTPISIEGVVRAGGSFSGGTWHSALEIMGSLRQKPKSTKPPQTDRKVRSLPQEITYRNDLGLYLLPMPTIDPQIVLNSARALPEYGADFRYGHFVGLKHAYEVAGLVAGVGTVFALAQLEPTRALLKKLRQPGEGPDEETRRKGWFRVVFIGKAGTAEVRCEVSGGDPGYSDTAKMISESALSLAFDELPPRFGVVTTAMAFGEALFPRLTRAGIQFEEIRA